MTQAAADHPEVFAHFGAEQIPERSTYPFSPVFPCLVAGRPAVLKRTRREPQDAAAVAAVTRQWESQGVRVVTPLKLDVPNPVRLADTHWVAYPFIDGDPYRGTPAQIAAAGDLLGRTHAATDGPARLPDFAWPDPGPESIAEDIEALRTVVADHVPAHVVARLEKLVSEFPTRVLPPIRDGALPHANTSMDYKANNLVYTAHGPVLVDPDNGDHAPRLLDLAQAALLFHTEHDPAPAAPLDSTGWSTFIDAYLQHVTLTDTERRLWPTALEYMLSEFGIWSLTSDPEDWVPARQREFLRALAGAEPAHFPLPWPQNG